MTIAEFVASVAAEEEQAVAPEANQSTNEDNPQ
jgi:hypothetical protein